MSELREAADRIRALIAENEAGAKYDENDFDMGWRAGKGVGLEQALTAVLNAGVAAGSVGAGEDGTVTP